MLKAAEGQNPQLKLDFDVQKAKIPEEVPTNRGAGAKELLKQETFVSSLNDDKLMKVHSEASK